MNPLRILFLSALILVAFSSMEADADKEPIWMHNYDNDRISAVSISADGEYIVGGPSLFSKNSSTPLWTYIPDDDWNDGRVTLTSISMDGQYIVGINSSSDHVEYKLWNKDGSTPLWSYVDESGSSGVDFVTISADGNYIAAIDGKKVLFFGKDSNQPLWSYDTGAWVYSVALSDDGEYVVAGTGSQDNKIYLFDKDSSTPLWSYTTGEGCSPGCEVYAVDISADGNYIVAGSQEQGSQENNIFFFDKDSSNPLWSYDTQGDVWSVSVSANGEYIIAGSNDDNLYLFDKYSSTPLWVYDMGDNVRATISADGEYIAAGSYEQGQVYLFNRDSNTTLWDHLIVEDPSELFVAISSSGDYIAIANGNVLRLMDSGPLPVVTIDSITPSPAIICSEITFNGSSSDEDGTIVEYEWLAENEYYGFSLFLSDKEDFVYSCFDYPIPMLEGDWNINFRAYYNDGDWTEDSTLLVIIPNQPPTAIIDSISPSPARFDDEITFNGTGSDSDGNVISYEWFSCLSSPDNPSISDCSEDIEWEFELLFLSDLEDFSAQVFYNDDWPGDSAAGTHFILLRVCDDNGGCSEAMTTIIVNPNSHPNVINSIEPNPAEKGTTVFFNGTGSDSDGAIVAYLWESSIDGELSTKANFSSNNLSLGHHTITFQVQDNDGDWVYTNSSLFVFTYPIAIAGQDSTGTPGVPLQFSGAATDEDGTVVLYEWDFDGDGIFEWSSTENGRELNIYNNEGTYTATLRVTDNDGFTGTDKVEITISEKKVQIDDEGNVTVTDVGEDEEGIPSISLIISLISIGLLAIFRRK